MNEGIILLFIMSYLGTVHMVKLALGFVKSFMIMYNVVTNCPNA